MSRTRRLEDPAVAECLPLHPLEARILVVLADGPAHGYRIVQQIERRDAAWAKVFPANLYRRIRSLAARGLIQEVAAGESPRGRRSFELTSLGRAVARAEGERLRELLADFTASNLFPQPRKR